MTTRGRRIRRLLVSIAVGVVVLGLLGWQLALWYFERGIPRAMPLAHCPGIATAEYESAIEKGRRIMAAMVSESGTPGMAIAVSVRGQIVWSEGFGYADSEARTAACPRHQFRVASVSKPLTTAGLARLFEQGRLDLDRDVRAYVPEFPDKGHVITARQLASHRSGIRNYHDDAEAVSVIGYPNVMASMARFKDDPLLFEPDTKSTYSAYGYVLLSAVMERAAGKDFRDFMREEVFAPLGMRASEIASYQESYQPKATYYDNVTPYSVDGRTVRSPVIDMSYKWAAGGILSTVEDLVRFGDAMIPSNQRGYLNAENVALMWRPRTGFLGFGYGLGWIVGRDPHFRKVAFHFGAGSGARSFLAVVPGQRTTVAILGNLGHAELSGAHLLRLMTQFAGDPALPLFLVLDAVVAIGALLALAGLLRSRRGRQRGMEHLVRISVVALLLLLGSGIGAAAQSDGGRLHTTDSLAIQDYLERSRSGAEVPGVSAAIGLRGSLVFSGGVGYSNLDNLVPQTGRTVHNIGSVSKTHAVVAIMQLVAQGRVRLDTVIQAYVPFMPAQPWPITVRQILTHTSGIRHYGNNDFGPDGLAEARHYDSYEESTRFWRGDSLLFKPGTFWSYSSYATGLMHGIVEKASGARFEEYLKLHVWEPAGMLSTSVDKPSQIFHNRGHGYERDQQGRLVNARYADVSYKYASGGIISSVEDLVRFGIALNRGRLLKRETLDSMYRIQVGGLQVFNRRGPPRPMPFEQGLVWIVQRDSQGRQYVGHGGSVKGTRTMLVNYPDLDLVVAVSANGEPYDAQAHAQAVAQLAIAALSLDIRR